MSQSPAKTRPWLHWPPTRGEWLQALLLLGVFLVTPVLFFLVAIWGDRLAAAVAPVLTLMGMALVLFFVLALAMFAWALLVGLLKRL